MSAFQPYLLPVATIISGILIVYAIYTYRHLRKKRHSSSGVDGSGNGSRERRISEDLELQIVLAVFVIASFFVFTGWFLYYDSHIKDCGNDTPEALTQTETIIEWLQNLLYCLSGCAAFFISLAFVVIKVSTSAFSIRAFESVLHPLDEDRGIVWAGVFIYCLAALECLGLVMALSFRLLELSDLKTLWGFSAVFLFLILCVVAFEILGLFFVRAFRITQSDHIIETELTRISSMYDQTTRGDPNGLRRSKIPGGSKIPGVQGLLRSISGYLNRVWNMIAGTPFLRVVDPRGEDQKTSPGEGEDQKTSPGEGPNTASPDKNEIEKSLQLISNVINLSIQQYDTRSSHYGITQLSRNMCAWINRCTWIKNQKITESYIKKMTTSAKVALLQGDEVTAMHIIDTLNESVLYNFIERLAPQEEKENPQDKKEDPPSNETDDNLGTCFCSHMRLLIDSYSDLSQFSVERSYIDFALKCVESLASCNDELFNYYTQEIGADDPPLDTTKRDVTRRDQTVNLYDLSAECVRSVSIVSQIAAKKNYETLVVRTAETTSRMHETLRAFLAKHPGLSTSPEEEEVLLPKKLLSHYIWSIEDAGVSAANNNLEWGAIKYSECLKCVGKDMFSLTSQYNESENVTTIAILMAHTSTALRDIGQELAKGKFQEGTIRAMSAIRELAEKMLTKEGMLWIREDEHGKATSEKHDAARSKEQGEDKTEKLAFVRATWNIKDIGRSAAESGIEKAVVAAAEELFTLMHAAQTADETAWKDIQSQTSDADSENARKTEGLLRIAESFYEISMKTRDQGLQDALTKIIYTDVISVRCLDEDTARNYQSEQVLNTYSKAFVHLQPVEEFTEERVRRFLESLPLDRKLQFYERYRDHIDEFSKRICNYYRQACGDGTAL